MNLIIGLIASFLTVIGFFLPLDIYLTPKIGAGYWFGIIGATMMGLLFTYSLRKRYSFLNWTPQLSKWFNFHMFLGMYGPIFILYHCRYSLGSQNSNIALISMIIAACSGVVGRFLYNKKKFEKLFSLWHAFHLPFVSMLIFSSIVHIFSVNMY